MSQFNVDVLGRVFMGDPVAVTAERIAGYAAATNETDPVAIRGQIAPPAFAFTALRRPLREALAAATPLYRELRGVHGEHDLRVLARVEPGMELTPVVEIVGLHQRVRGVAVVAHARALDGDENLVSDQYATLFFPGAELRDENVGRPAPDHRFPTDLKDRPPEARVVQHVDDDQPARYAAASGDTGRYHLDADFARSVGLPGIIVHGMCTMAFAGRALAGYAAAGISARIRRVAVRFAHPVRPGQELVTSIWRIAGEHEGASEYAFETALPGGVVVLRHGRVEIR